MYKINLINQDWELISVINVTAIPRESDYVYLETENAYYMTVKVVHNILKGRFRFRNILRGRFRNKAVISVVVSRIHDIKK